MPSLRSPWNSETVHTAWSYGYISDLSIVHLQRKHPTSCLAWASLRWQLTVTAFQHEVWDDFSLHPSAPLMFCLVIWPPAQSSQMSETTCHWLKDHPLWTSYHLKWGWAKVRSCIQKCEVPAHFTGKSLLLILCIKTLTQKGKGYKNVSSMRGA